MNQLFYISIIIISFFFFYKFYNRFIKNNLNKNNNEHFQNNLNNNKPYLWLYWEVIDKTPAYIELCYDTVLKHCSSDFNIIRLNEKTIYDYLPDLQNKHKQKLLKKLNIPQKSDYYRYHLLYKYGGIWLDSDIIVFSSLLPLYKHLNNNIDYVGAGCHSKKCIPNGAPYPANWIMISKPNTHLMNLMIDGCDVILKQNSNNINYHNLGRNLLWKNIQFLQKNYNWNYYHIPSQCFERDSYDNKYINKRLISEENLDNNCDNLIFVPIYNSAPGFPPWFKNMNKKQIMNSNLLISKFFHKSLS